MILKTEWHRDCAVEDRPLAMLDVVYFDESSVHAANQCTMHGTVVLPGRREEPELHCLVVSIMTHVLSTRDRKRGIRTRPCT